MTHHIPHVLDTIIISAATIASAAAAALIDSAAPTGHSAELQLFLLPFIGALVLSGGMIMLNPQPETRKIVIGRSSVALFFGVLAPQIIGAIHPNLAALSIKPVFLVLFGGIFAALAYVLAAAFTRQLYARADGVAKRAADVLEHRYVPSANDNQPPASPSSN